MSGRVQSRYRKCLYTPLVHVIYSSSFRNVMYSRMASLSDETWLSIRSPHPSKYLAFYFFVLRFSILVTRSSLREENCINIPVSWHYRNRQRVREIRFSRSSNRIVWPKIKKNQNTIIITHSYVNDDSIVRRRVYLHIHLICKYRSLSTAPYNVRNYTVRILTVCKVIEKTLVR